MIEIRPLSVIVVVVVFVVIVLFVLIFFYIFTFLSKISRPISFDASGILVGPNEDSQSFTEEDLTTIEILSKNVDAFKPKDNAIIVNGILFVQLYKRLFQIRIKAKHRKKNYSRFFSSLLSRLS